MKKLLLISAVLVLCGCAKSLTNQEIVQQTAYCHENGMRAARYTNFAGETFRIECRPPRED